MKSTILLQSVIHLMDSLEQACTLVRVNDTNSVEVIHQNFKYNEELRLRVPAKTGSTGGQHCTSCYSTAEHLKMYKNALRTKQPVNIGDIKCCGHHVFSSEFEVLAYPIGEQELFIQYESKGTNLSSCTRDERNEEQLSLIYNSTTDMMGMVEMRQGKFVFVSANKAMLERLHLMGISKDRFIGTALRGHLTTNLNMSPA